MRFLVLLVLLAGPSSAALAPTPRPMRARTLAVLNFDNHTGRADYDPMGGGMAAMLISDLSVSPDLKLVERERMQDVLAEQKMQRSPMFDSTTAVKAGKLLGAEFIATGSMTAAATDLRFDMRLIRVQTGEIVKTARATGPEDKLFDLEKELADEVLKDLEVALSPESAALLKKRQDANRQLGVSAFKNVSGALAAIDAGDYVSAVSKLQPLMMASPDSRLVSLAYQEAKHRAATKAEDAAKKKAADLLKGLIKRPPRA